MCHVSDIVNDGINFILNCPVIKEIINIDWIEWFRYPYLDIVHDDKLSGFGG